MQEKYKELPDSLYSELSIVNILSSFIHSYGCIHLYVYICILHITHTCIHIYIFMSIVLQILQCAFPKNKNILLHNHSTMIKIRKHNYNTDTALLANLCVSYSNLASCLNKVLYSCSFLSRIQSRVTCCIYRSCLFILLPLGLFLNFF